MKVVSASVIFPYNDAPIETYSGSNAIFTGSVYFNKDSGSAYIWNGVTWISGFGTSGTSGQTGTSGTSGQTGTSGTSGTSGQTGTSGTSGIGTSGTSGQAGSSGTSGAGGSGGPISGSIQIQLYNSGLDLTTGIKDIPVMIPYSGQVVGWDILAYNGSNTLVNTSAVVDILSDSINNLPLAGTDSIAGTQKPTLSSEATASLNALTTWTPITASNYIQAEIESINTGVARLLVALKIMRT